MNWLFLCGPLSLFGSLCPKSQKGKKVIGISMATPNVKFI
jgi:hypothetical protein